MNNFIFNLIEQINFANGVYHVLQSNSFEKGINVDILENKWNWYFKKNTMRTKKKNWF